MSVPGNFLDEILYRTKEILNHVEEGVVKNALFNVFIFFSQQEE